MLLFALHNSISTVNTKFCAYRQSLYSLKFKHFWVNNQMLINTFLILFIFLSYLYNDGYKTYQANVNHTYTSGCSILISSIVIVRSLKSL